VVLEDIAHAAGVDLLYHDPGGLTLLANHRPVFIGDFGLISSVIVGGAYQFGRRLLVRVIGQTSR
jgi:hypothetical protein